MRNFHFFSFMYGGCVAIAIFTIIRIAGKEAPHKCEFTVPYQVYPALTITCDEVGRIACDTLYTYSDWGKR